MKDFSMYDCALKAAGASFEDLGTVSHVSRRDFDERPTFGFRARVPCLEYISLLIENALLLRTHRAGRLYAGFEKLSRMEPVVELIRGYVETDYDYPSTMGALKADIEAASREILEGLEGGALATDAGERQADVLALFDRRDLRPDLVAEHVVPHRDDQRVAGVHARAAERRGAARVETVLRQVAAECGGAFAADIHQSFELRELILEEFSRLLGERRKAA